MDLNINSKLTASLNGCLELERSLPIGVSKAFGVCTESSAADTGAGDLVHPSLCFELLLLPQNWCLVPRVEPDLRISCQDC